MLPIVERMLSHAESLKRAGRDHVKTMSGQLTIATTHSQARYALPGAVMAFRALHPEVSLRLHQGSPEQVARLLKDRQADVGIATEALSRHPQLLTLACYTWTHLVVVPRATRWTTAVR
jgi:LysR family cys regulon transcriptional activator